MPVAWGKPSELVLGSCLPVCGAEFHPADPAVLVIAGSALAVIYRITPGEALRPDDEPPLPRKPVIAAAEVIAIDEDEAAVNEESLLEKWLYGRSIKPPVKCERVQILREHTNYLVNLHWSPSGEFLATCDATAIHLWHWKDRTCTRFHTFNSNQEIFDFCWVDDHIVAVGCIKTVVLMRRNTRLVEIELPEGTLCKGLCANFYERIDAQTKTVLLCIATSANQHVVYCITLGNDTVVSVQKWREADEKVFQGGDVPLLRTPCMEPLSRCVFLPYGERYGQYFGICWDLDDSNRQFRLRGHQARVSCVAVGNVWKKFEVPADRLVAHCPAFAGQTELVEALQTSGVTDSEYWPWTILYAQASADGCLSIWWLFWSTNGGPLSAQCLMVSPQSVVDQAALITSLTWSCDDRLLAIGSDDGKTTILVVQLPVDTTPTVTRRAVLERNGPRLVIPSAATPMKIPPPPEPQPATASVLPASPVVLVTPEAK